MGGQSWSRVTLRVSWRRHQAKAFITPCSVAGLPPTRCMRFWKPAMQRCSARLAKRFMKLHGKVFWALGLLQRFWYGTDTRREKFVAMCRDPDVQTLTWQAYTTKKLVRRRPFAHIRVFFKDVAQLLGLARA